MKSKLALLIVVGMALSSCTTVNSISPQEYAAKAGFNFVPIDAGDYLLASWQKRDPETTTAHVYIEGDGKVWQTPARLSNDPTPENPLALSLAARDPHATVIYLARPCQHFLRGCRQDDWGQGRYGEAIVTATNTALDHLRAQGIENFALIGYSGGGAVAALVAARRNDILSLRTVAGNLDLAAFADQHQAPPLAQSLDPLGIADSLSDLAQVHFVAEYDPIVPKQAAQNWIEKTGHRCTHFIWVEKTNHSKGWVEIWENLIKTQPHCAQE